MPQRRPASGDKSGIDDMDNGAGFEYTCKTDLEADGLHPNETGYSKMAALWFSSITSNYNTSPVITNIPDQTLDEGESSMPIILDNYVADIEDTDQEITWTIKQLGVENLNIVINAERHAVAMPKNPEWSGSQTVVLTATDLGNNGKYIKTDSDTVIYIINRVNDPPVITSTPPLGVRVGEIYSYNFTATDIDNTEIALSTVIKPDWLSFSEETGVLSGTPALGNQGGNQLILRASDGFSNTDQNFTIVVDNPVALHDPETAILTLYPVPAQTYLIVEFGNLTGETLLEVINISGILLQKIPVQDNQNSYRLDLGKLENGIYYLHLINKSVNYFGKFSIIK